MTLLQARNAVHVKGKHAGRLAPSAMSPRSQGLHTPPSKVRNPPRLATDDTDPDDGKGPIGSLELLKADIHHG